jgi:hypothetical protein
MPAYHRWNFAQWQPLLVFPFEQARCLGPYSFF